MKTKPKTNPGVSIGEMIMMQYRLHGIRQSHEKTAAMLSEMEKKLAALLAPHQAKKH